MKKILCFLLLAAIVLCACSKTENETDTATRMIDFSDYTVEEVITWANENNVSSKFNFIYSADSDKPIGSVIAQSVVSGEKITDDVEITVSAKPMLTAGDEYVAVPNVLGKNFSEAKADLTSLGFRVDAKYENSGKEKDTVILSDPLPGNIVEENSTILLTLSAGAKEKSVSIVLEIKSGSSKNNQIKVYVDGELDRSKTVVLDPSVTSKTFTFYGEGTKEIKFKINNEVAAVYSVCFETSEVNIID